MAGMVSRLLGLALRLLLVACVPTADGLLGRGASTQAEGVFETWPLREGGGILEAMSAQKISLSTHRSTGCSRGSSRPIRFEPPMLDFHEQPVGMPKMETVFLHNPSAEETITLLSISATTSHFHASFFQNRVIPPGGNTSFEVVFLARVVGNVENTLFINTSRHGVFTYQVFGVGIPNPYRLRPFVGARVPVNSSFSPLINIHNPHSEPLQVVEIYSSGGDLHLELPTGQAEGPKKLWEIPPFETKAVMRASFVSREADNHTAFIRIRTNGSEPHQYLILPVEVEVTTVPGIYSSIEMLDFGTLRTQDTPKTLNLYLLNSGSKDVPITSVKLSPPNDAVSVEFKPITLKAQERKYAKVASVTYDPSKVKRPLQSSGKIVVKAKEKSYPKLEIVYQAEVLEGYLGYDQAATLFHVREGETEPSERPVLLTNTFNFSIILHNVSLPPDVLHMLQVKNFSRAVLLRPQESCYAFSLAFAPAPLGVQGAVPAGLATNVMLATNASHFQLPVQAYTGFLSHVVLPPSLQESQLEFGVLGAADMVRATVLILNSNPIELELKGWQVIGEGLTAELLGVERGNRTTAQAAPDLESRQPESHQRPVTLPPGHYAALRVTLSGAGREGTVEGALQVSTAYEILTIPVTAVIAVGSLSSLPSHVHLQASFPGKVVQQPVWVASSFSRAVRVEAVRPLGTDSRFYFRRAEDGPEELEPGQKTKIGNIYFNASAACDTDCYVGAGARWQDNLKKEPADTDSKLFRELQRRWASMRERGLHRLEAGFEVDTDLYKQVPVRVVAQLTWPSLVNTSGRPLTFPLTNRNTSSVEELILENLADVPVVCQVFPVRWYPSPGTAVRLLSERLNLEKYNVNETSGVFSVISDITKPGASSGSPLVRIELGPGERRSVGIRFTPTSNHTETTLILIRNNLTVLDGVVVSGRGVNEALRLAGRPPGPNASLRFKVTEAVLRDCTDKSRPKLPTFTLTRTFRVENVGPLPLHVAAPEVSGLRCEGYGFRVVDCSVFVLEPNATRDIVIAFTPDFTASRVIRELRLRTARGSEFAFVLNASLPYHMLATCAEALPRPSWEAFLYAAVLGLVVVTLPCVLAVAFMDAQEQWRQFRKQQQAEAEQSLCEGLTDRPFDLRKIGASLMQEHSALTQESTASTRGRGLPSTSSVATQRNSASRQHQHHHSQHHHQQQQHGTDSHQTRGGALGGQQTGFAGARGSPGSAGASRGSPGSGSSAPTTAPPPHRSGNGGSAECGTAGTTAAQGPSGKKQRNAKVQNSSGAANSSSSSNQHSHHQQQTSQLPHATQQTQNQPSPVPETLTHQCGTQTPDKDERALDIQAPQLGAFLNDVTELSFERKRSVDAGRPNEPEVEAEAQEEEEEEEEERGEREGSEQSTAVTTAMEALMGEMDGDEPSHAKRSSRGKKTAQRKVAKLQKRREDRERRVAVRGDDDDSSSTTTEASNPDLEPPHPNKTSEQPLKPRSQASPPARKHSTEGIGGYGSRPGGAGGVSSMAVTTAVTSAAVVAASGGGSRKNGGGSRRDLYPDLREASSLELPYTTQFEQRQRRKDSSGFSSKPSSASSLKADVNPRNSKHGGFTKQRGKGSAGPTGARTSFGLNTVGTAGGSGGGSNGGGKTSPAFASDPESSGTASRTNSSSEGEKDHSPPPEWDLPSMAGKASSSTDSLHKLSLQTLNAEPLLNRHSRGSPVSGPSSPAPTQQGASYSSVVASNGDVGTKQTGSAVKGKLTKATSLPGRNGNPTFAAVAAGHEKMIAPLADPRKAVLEKSNSTGSLMLEEPCGFVEPTVPSDEVLASSVNAYRPSVFTQSPPYTPPLTFSAFGPSNSFDLTGEVFGRSRSGSGPQSSVGSIGSGLTLWAYNRGPSGGGGGSSPPASVAPPAVMTAPPCSASSSRCSSASPWSVLLSDPRNSSQGLWSTGPSSPTSPTTSSPLLMGASNNMWAAHPLGSIWSTPGDTGLTFSVSTAPGHHPSSPSSHPSSMAPPPGSALPSSLSLQATSSNSSSSSSPSSSNSSPFAGHTGSQSGIVGRGAGDRMVAAPHPAHGDTPLAPFNPFGCSGLDHIWRPGPPPAAQRRSPWELPDA